VIEKPCFDSGLGGTWFAELELDAETVREEVADGRAMSLLRELRDSLVEL
jgi:hypothetical protein